MNKELKEKLQSKLFKQGFLEGREFESEAQNQDLKEWQGLAYKIGKKDFKKELSKKIEDLRKPVLMPGSYKELIKQDKPNQAYNQALEDIKKL